jgi:hypothetical protein
MGVLTSFFEDLRRESKGRLERILVVVDVASASEALVRMLGPYYTEAQHRYTQTGLPHVKILHTSVTETPLDVSDIWMERTKVGHDDNVSRVGLEFKRGRIWEIPVDSSTTSPLSTVLNCFASDSRKEASSILWSKIISVYAKQGNYDVVLWNDTATQIAAKVLALTSQGRGFTLPWECGSLVKMPNGIPFATLIQGYTPRVP